MPSPRNKAILASNRNTFVWKWIWWFLDTYGTGTILNIGCADDPMEIGPEALHVDLDDWSAYHENFLQSDAQSLDIPDQSGHIVILGDVLEHIPNPFAAIRELVRVTEVGGFILLTVFEEWRLPGYGQHIEAGQLDSDNDSRKLGYTDRLDAQLKMFPDMVMVDDKEHPHLCHINQFDDEDIETFVQYMLAHGCEKIEFMKQYEAMHEGHPVFNWLICMRRVK